MLSLSFLTRVWKGGDTVCCVAAIDLMNSQLDFLFCFVNFVTASCMPEHLGACTLRTVLSCGLLKLIFTGPQNKKFGFVRVQGFSKYIYSCAVRGKGLYSWIGMSFFAHKLTFLTLLLDIWMTFGTMLCLLELYIKRSSSCSCWWQYLETIFSLDRLGC